MTDSGDRQDIPLVSGSVVFDGWHPTPDAIVEVEVLDVTYVDAPSTVHAAERFRFADAETSPDDVGDVQRVSFSVFGDVEDGDAEYIVAVRVAEGNDATVVGRTVAAYPVLTFGHDSRNVEVRVEAMPKESEDSD